MLKREQETRERARAEERAAAPWESRPTYDELQRRCAEKGLVIGAKRGSRVFDAEAEQVRQQYGISKEAWHALPRASDL